MSPRAIVGPRWMVAQEPQGSGQNPAYRRTRAWERLPRGGLSLVDEEVVRRTDTLLRRRQPRAANSGFRCLWPEPLVTRVTTLRRVQVDEKCSQHAHRRQLQTRSAGSRERWRGRSPRILCSGRRGPALGAGAPRAPPSGRGVPAALAGSNQLPRVLDWNAGFAPRADPRLHRLGPQPATPGISIHEATDRPRRGSDHCAAEPAASPHLLSEPGTKTPSLRT